MTSAFALSLAVLGLAASGCARPEPAEEPAHDPAHEAIADGRRVAAVPAEVQVAVRAEMRTMLGSLHGILTAAATGDTAAMRAAAVKSGIATAADPHLEGVLPPEFIELGSATHRQFDEFAAALGGGMPVDSVAGRLGRITGACVSCHETWRLESR